MKAFDDLALQTMTNMASTFRQAGKDELAKLFKVLPRNWRRSRSSKSRDNEPAGTERSGIPEPEPEKSG